MKSIKEIKKKPNLQPKLVIAADQMIGNLSMKIGEVDSGSARLLCVAKFLNIWSLLKGVKLVICPSLTLLTNKRAMAL